VGDEDHQNSDDLQRIAESIAASQRDYLLAASAAMAKRD
jgi:hypothetical protein